MTFNAWLRRQRHRQDPVGDLARDAFSDPHWPPVARHQRKYLVGVNSCEGAMAALDRAHTEWRADR
jgi:uncharacterized protein YozE (UPF0346 family)